MKKTLHKRHEGFTLIELILVIAFLGSLMLLASASIVQAINIYNKGNAIKQINQAGRALIEDINRLSSSGAEVEIDDNGTAGCLRVGFTGGDGRVFLWNSAASGLGGTAASAGDRTWIWASGTDAVSLVQSTETTDTSNYCYLPSTSEPGNLVIGQWTPVLARQVRILSVDIANSTDSSLKKLTFWIGTHDGTTDGSNVPGMTPTRNADATWTCQGGSIGNFCAVSKFETVLYTPNAGGTP